ncbi:MAG: alpha/beta hydrolase fold domain-containing protein [Oscillospiraceae bacterium]
MLGEMNAFADAGYVVASIYYRSSAQGHYPDQIRDVKEAIRFLRANAAKFEIDPEHIGVFGRSAGGHLACHGCHESGRRRRGGTSGPVLQGAGLLRHVRPGWMCWR